MGKVFNQDIAKAFAMDEKYIFDLIYCRDWHQFFLREGNYYRMLDTEEEFLPIVRTYVNKNFSDQNHTMSNYKDIVNQLRYEVERSFDSVETPYIALNDATLDLNTMEVIPNDIKRIVTHKINVDSASLEKPTPEFRRYLDTVIVDNKDKTKPDVELQELTQEMMGSYLLPHLKTESMFFLVGGGSNGKSIMISLLEELIGREWCTSMSIEKLTTDKFAPYNLIGKKLNVCNEEESKHIRIDKFKGFVTGDSQSAEKKGEQSFMFSPTTKHAFATNGIPSFSGIDGGLKRRIKIIKFNRKFEDHEKDKDMLEKLKGELGGILGFAIKGAKRLINNNYNFSRPRQFLEALDEFESDISAPLNFFKSNYVVDEDQSSNTIFKASQELYNEFTDWCVFNGKKANNQQNFFKDLKGQIPFFEDNETRKRVDGKQVRGVMVRKIDEDYTLEEIETFEGVLLKPSYEE